MNTYLVTWAVLAVAVLVIAVYRTHIAHREDQTLHLAGQEAALVTEQQVLSRKLKVVDRWGQVLTVVVAAYGIALLAVYFYHLWFKGYQIQ